MAISKKSWLGIAREATPGTAITTPTLYIPCKSMMKNVQKREYLMEERGTRDKDYDVINTTRSSSWDVKGPFYPDAHAYFLLGAMGGVVSAAQSNPNVYKHTLSLADIPPSFTLMKSFDAATYYTPYSVVEKFGLKLSGAEKLIEFDASGQGMWMLKQVSPPSPTIPDTKPFAGYSPTITLASGASSDIIDLEIDFTQKVTLFYPAAGVPDFATAYFGEREASFKFTARFDNDTLYQKFLNGTQDTLTFDVLGAVIGKSNVVTLGSPSAGTFTLTYGGQTTAGIQYNAAASAVQTALQALSAVGTNGTVSGSAGGPYTVSFSGSALNDGNTLTGSGTGLTGGSFNVGATVTSNSELNIALPTISYDSMEHDLGKDNVLIKAAGKAVVGSGASLMTAFVQNLIHAYTS